MTTRSGRRLLAAGAAVGLAVVLLTSGAGTLAGWHDERSAATGSITAGSVELTSSDAVLHLQSRQPVGARTFASSQTCALASGATECRVVTTGLANERLIPGDRVQIRLDVTLTGEGDNLAGDLTVDAGTVVVPGASDLSAAATTQITLTPPQGSSTTVDGAELVLPVDVGSGHGAGTYAVLVEVGLPTARPGGARWDTGLRAQLLDLDTLAVSFTQK